MRKKASVSLILIVLLAVIMAVTLAACNRTPTDVNDLPSDLGGQSTDNTLQKSTPAYLKFYFPLPNSVFQGMFIDEFDIEDVEFSVVYVNDAGIVVSEVPLGNVTEEMVKEEDRPKLTTPGHHEITISTTLSSGDVVSGTTKIHLKDHSGKIERVKVTINLNGGYTTNGELDESKQHATISIDKGYEFTDWEEFVSVFRLSKDASALHSVQVEKQDGTAVTLSYNEGFPFVLDEDCTLDTEWTENVIKVTFHLNVPDNAELTDPENDPRQLFAENGRYHTQNVEKTVGRIVRPETDRFNVFKAIYFAGWYTRTEKDGGYEYTAWNFNSSVNTEDIELYARWTERLYSFTIYSMGGQFRSDVASDVDGAELSAYTKITATSAFSAKGGAILNRITFTGFTYDKDYTAYIADVNVGGRIVTLKFSDFYGDNNKLNKLFEKGTSFIKADGLYTSYDCLEKIENQTHVVADGVAYIGWATKSADEYEGGEGGDAYKQALSDYTVNYLFKDSYALKTDGSVSLTKISGDAVNTMIIPAEVYADGQWRKVSEIGTRACMNVKSLTQVDVSGASNLATIGEQAFAHCVNLKEIKGLDTIDSVTSVGTNAFEDTAFEDNYYEDNHQKQFIVISKIIYKYVGKPVDSIDLSSENYYTEENMPNVNGDLRAGYNKRLFEATSIMSGVFSGCPSLKRITLSQKVETIDNGAFTNLNSLEALIVPADSALNYVGESAFSDFFLSESNLYNRNDNAIYIGHILYRMIDRSATSFTVPASVTCTLRDQGPREVSNTFEINSIAPNAFIGCSKLQDIQFADASKINVIGKDAFLSTKYIQTSSGSVNEEGNGTYVQDGFTVVNGILTAFYGTRSNVNVTLPSTGNIRISEYAFNNYATNLNSILISSNVTAISNNAFNGASNLAALIFPNIEVDEGGKKLVGAPRIASTSFDNNYGVTNENLRFYLRASVIEFFKNVTSGDIVLDEDEATSEWYNMYRYNTEKFIAEKLDYVQVDPTKVANKLLRTGKTGDAFRDKYGDETIADALIVMSNSGVQRRESLNATANEISLVASKGSVYILHYTYQEQKFGVAGDLYPFEIEVYDYREPKDNTAFYSSAYYPDDVKEQSIESNRLTKNGNSTYPFWIEGLDGNTGAEGTYPTFWSSTRLDGLEPTFHYLDYNNKEHSFAISLDDIDGLSFADDNSGRQKTAHIHVNFYGVGVYEINFYYLVSVPKYEKIEQVNAFKMPLNANGNTYRASFYIRMTRQDGSVSMLSATNSNSFTITQVDGKVTSTLPTNDLGFHTVKFRYTDHTLAVSDLELTAVYSVVLEEDPTLFTFAVLNEFERTAKITATTLKAQGASVRTVVIPSTCVIGGKTYTITQIGEHDGTAEQGVFAGLTNLTTVYLSSKITDIGNYAFAGCTSLRNIYTSQETTSSKTPLTADNFEKYSDKAVDEIDGKKVYNVLVSKVESDDYEAIYTDDTNEIVEHFVFTLDSQYVFGNEIYRVIGFKNALVMPEPTDGAGKNVYMYLPSSIWIQSVTYYMDGDQQKEIQQYGEATSRYIAIVYDSDSEYRSRVYNRFNSALTRIGNCAFVRCTSLVRVDLSASTSLRFLGDSAFAESGIQTIDLSKNLQLKDLGASMFADCTALTSVTLPTILTTIGESCFNGCVSLVKLMTGNTVFGTGGNLVQNFVIGSRAFGRCTSLMEIHLWKGIKSVGMSAFNSCYALTVYCDFAEAELPGTWANGWDDYANDIVPQKEKVPIVYSDKSGVATDGVYYYVDSVSGLRFALYHDGDNYTATVVRQSASLTEVTIPATVSKDGQEYKVTAIGDYAFKNQTNLVSVKIESTHLTAIGEAAFMGCENLSNLEIPEGVEFDRDNVAIDAFQDCTKLPDTMRPKIKEETLG